LWDGVAPVTYGLVRPTEEEIEAHDTLFPHARSAVNGGCAVGDDPPVRVRYCPACREGEAAWRQAQARR
jgi:hypothetical protein